MDCTDKPLREFNVAFRYYNKDLGHRVDPQGRALIGWTAKYDSWRSSSCTSIAPANSMTIEYCHVEQKRMEPTNEVDDKGDTHFLNAEASRPHKFVEPRP